MFQRCTFNCTSCHQLQSTSSNKFNWMICKHPYCQQCVSNIINESLSFLNQVPKCIYPNCNQPLSINCPQPFIIKRLLAKYKSKNTVDSYHRKQHLISGYIRDIDTYTIKAKIIPIDINLIIFNYYDLICHTNIDCISCKATGSINCKCRNCKGVGYNRFILPAGQCYMDCRACDGSGEPISNCMRCNGTGLTCGRCAPLCYHFVDIQNISRLGTGFRCDPRGKKNVFDHLRKHEFKSKPVICIHCNGSGTCRWENCENCIYTSLYAKKILKIRLNCFSCGGGGKKRVESRIQKYNCMYCKQSGIEQMICNDCYGNKQVMALDFNRLCDFQSLCTKCNAYFPNDSVIYWSECKHIFCDQCFYQMVKNEIKQNKIPKCMQSKCAQELKPVDLKLDFNKCKQYNWSRIVRKLETLIDRKNKGECPCTQCRKWYPIKESMACSKCKNKYCNACIRYWSKCNHSCCDSCIQQYVPYEINRKNVIPQCMNIKCNEELSINTFRTFRFYVRGITGSLERKLEYILYLKDHFRCTLCLRYHLNKDIFLWSTCQHKYSKDCAKQYMGSCRSSKFKAVNIVNKLKKIPKCHHPGCGQLIKEKEAISIGIIRYEKNTQKQKKAYKKDDCLVM
eukprot:87590_1